MALSHVPIPHLHHDAQPLLHHTHIIDPTAITAMSRHASLIHNLSTKTYPPFQTTPFKFSLTRDAANHNISILSWHNNNPDDTLTALAKKNTARIWEQVQTHGRPRTNPSTSPPVAAIYSNPFKMMHYSTQQY